MPGNILDAIGYLTAAGRYDEATELYECFDSTFLASVGHKATFDNITTYLRPRYIVFRKARRDADALLLADSICAVIDSALAWQKKNDAAELAVIYQTHEKELALEEAKSETHTHRILLASAILIILLIIYLLRRSHIYNKVLAAKNRSLYEQIQQLELKEQQAIEQLKAEPEESLNVQQQLFRRLCTLMDEQKPYTDEGLNRDGLAQLLGTNAKYIDQAIHDCSFGETTGNFINRYRMEHVARLLKTTDEPISLIGEMVGIPSRVTLARLFRNTFGMTCTEYRQTAKQV